MNMSSRNCLQCNTSLAPGEKFCSNCGTPFIETNMTDPTQRSSGFNPNQPLLEPTQYAEPPSSPTPLPTQYAAPPPVPPYAGTAYGSSGQNYTPPPPPNQIGYPPSPYPAGPAIYGQQQPLPGGIYPPGLQGPPPKKGPNIALILGISFIVLLLACGGLFFVVLQNAPKTITTGTGTPQSTSTPDATLVPKPTPLFTDNFADNSKNWDVVNSQGFSSTINNNMLTMQEANHKVFAESFPTNSSYANFSITATFTLEQGDQNDSVGFYLRSAADDRQGYYVDIYGDNTYDIVKLYTDANQKIQQQNMVDPTDSSAIHPEGQQNKMTVVMKGSNIVLLLNDTVIKSVTDDSFTQGHISFFVQNGKTSNGVIATFTSVELDPPPDQLPS